jgi:hypothetical protein
MPLVGPDGYGFMLRDDSPWPATVRGEGVIGRRFLPRERLLVERRSGRTQGCNRESQRQASQAARVSPWTSFSVASQGGVLCDIHVLAIACSITEGFSLPKISNSSISMAGNCCVAMISAYGPNPRFAAAQQDVGNGG